MWLRQGSSCFERIAAHRPAKVEEKLGAIDMWWVLGIVAAISFFLMGREGRATAIGGGFTIGIIVGLVLAVIYSDWWLIGRSVTVGILIGLVAEILPKLLTKQR